MSTAKVACPHCGFLNFEISAYCARCERPMRAETNAPPPIVRAPDPTPASVQTTVAPRPAASPSATPPPPPAEALAEPRGRSPWVVAFEQLPRTAVYPATSNEVLGITRGTFAHTSTTLTADDEIITVVTTAPTAVPTVPIEAANPKPPSPPLESLEQAALALMPEPVTSVVPLAQLLNLAQRTPDGQPRAAVTPTQATTPAPGPTVTSSAAVATRRTTAPPATKVSSVEAPVASASTGESAVPVPAGALRAWVGRAIDATLAIGLGACVMGALARADGPVRMPRGLDALDVLADWLTMYPNATIAGFAAALAVGAMQGLVAALRDGKTLGRALTGTRLVRTSGAPASPMIVALRTGVSLVSLALFGAGYFWAIVDRRRRTWHDMFSGTVLARVDR